MTETFQTTAATASVVEMRSIMKCFSAVTTLEAVDLELRTGRILAMRGDKGAG